MPQPRKDQCDLGASQHAQHPGTSATSLSPIIEPHWVTSTSSPRSTPTKSPLLEKAAPVNPLPTKRPPRRLPPLPQLRRLLPRPRRRVRVLWLQALLNRLAAYVLLPSFCTFLLKGVSHRSRMSAPSFSLVVCRPRSIDMITGITGTAPVRARQPKPRYRTSSWLRRACSGKRNQRLQSYDAHSR